MQQKTLMLANITIALILGTAGPHLPTLVIRGPTWRHQLPTSSRLASRTSCTRFHHLLAQLPADADSSAADHEAAEDDAAIQRKRPGGTKPVHRPTLNYEIIEK